MKNFMTKYNRYDNPIDSFFDDAFSNLFRPVFYDEKFDSMKTDIIEHENDYELDVELAGYDKQNIAIDYENEYVTIRASRSEESESEKGNYLRKERSVSCQRSYYVGEIDDSKIKASYHDGVLQVTVPKAEAQKPQKKSINID